MNLSTVIIVMTFGTSILIISSSQISLAKENDKEEEEYRDLKKDIPVTSIDKTKDSNKIEVKNDILYDDYPNQYYFCGYPQQLVTDYTFFEKINCK